MGMARAGGRHNCKEIMSVRKAYMCASSSRQVPTWFPGGESLSEITKISRLAYPLSGDR